MGPYAGVDYNLTFCPLQSRLQHIYHGQLYNALVDYLCYRVDFIPQSGTLDVWIWHQGAVNMESQPLAAMNDFRHGGWLCTCIYVPHNSS
jgi:hypothetical protein